MTKKIVIELTKEQRDYLVSAMTCGAEVFNVKEAAEILTKVNAASALDRSMIEWHKTKDKLPKKH